MDSGGIILELHDMNPNDETSILAGSANVQFVFEVNRGWFEMNHATPGTIVRTEKGTLQDLLRGSD